MNKRNEKQKFVNVTSHPFSLRAQNFVNRQNQMRTSNTKDDGIRTMGRILSTKVPFFFLAFSMDTRQNRTHHHFDNLLPSKKKNLSRQKDGDEDKQNERLFSVAFLFISSIHK